MSDKNLNITIELKGKNKVSAEFKVVQKDIKGIEDELRALKKIADGVVIDPDVSADDAKKKIKELSHVMADLKAREKELREETRTLDDELKKTAQTAKDNSDKWQKLGAALSGISTAATAISVALGAIAGTGLLVGKSLLDAASDAENMKVAMMTAFQGDTAGAEQLLSTLQEMANSTNFLTSEYVEAGVKLKAYGTEADQIPNKLKLIGDMAAGMGKSLDQAVEAYADASTGELERLKEFGVTKAMIDEKVNGALSNTKDKAEQVSLVMEGLTQIMEERFAGGMEDASKTLTGQLSTLQGEFESLKSELGEELLPVAKEAVSGLTEFVRTLKNIDPETKKVIVSVGALGTGLVGIGAVMAGVIAAGASLAANVISIGTAITGSTVAMGALEATGFMISTVFTEVIPVIAGFVAQVIAIPVAIGASVIALEELARGILNWKQALADTQAQDAEARMKGYADALREVQAVLPGISNGTQAYNKIKAEGIEALIQEEAGLEKVLAVSKLLVQEELKLTDSRSEHKKALDALMESYLQMKQGKVSVSYEEMVALEEEITKEKNIMEAIDGQIAGKKELRNEINSATADLKEQKNVVESVQWGQNIDDKKLKEAIKDIERLGQLGNLKSKEDEINGLIELTQKFNLTEEQRIDVYAKLEKATSGYYKSFEEGLKTSLKNGDITEKEFQEARKKHLDEYIRYYKYNDGLRAEITADVNAEIKNLDKDLVDARLQMQADIAASTPDIQDDIQAEFDIRYEAIQRQKQELLDLGATAQEVAQWENTMVKDAQTSITAKYKEEAEKKKGIIKEVGQTATDTLLSEEEAYKKQFDTWYKYENEKIELRKKLIDLEKLESGNKTSLSEEKAYLEDIYSLQQKLVSEIEQEGEYYRNKLKMGEDLTEIEQAILEQYIAEKTELAEIGQQIENNKSKRMQEYEDNLKILETINEIRVREGEITQEQADRETAAYKQKMIEANKENIEQIIEMVKNGEQLTDWQKELLDLYNQEQAEVLEINTALGEVKTSTDKATEATKGYNNALKDVNDTLETTKKTMADINNLAIQGRENVMSGDFGSDGETSSDGTSSGGSSKGTNLWDTVDYIDTGFSNAGNYGFDNPKHDRQAYSAGEKYAGAVLSKSTEDMLTNFLSGMVSKVQGITNNVSNSVTKSSSSSSYSRNYYDQRKSITQLSIDNKSQEVPALLKHKLGEINTFNSKYLAG